ncbi:MAG: cobalt ECF transporter T component CbiQ [Syntrophobacteraceae bacterium]
MEQAAKIIEINALFPVLGLAAAGILIFLSIRVARRGLNGPSADYLQGAVDLSGPRPENNGGLPDCSWDPRVRIVSVLTFVFCTAYLQNLLFALAALALSAASVPASGASLRKGIGRLAAMAGFLAMFVLVLPLTVPARGGDTLAVISGLPGISFNLRGMELAALICVKAAAIAFLVEMLLGNTPFSVLIQALESLRVPQPICRMAALTHRYMFVIGDEARRMLRGMRVRGFRGGSFPNTARAVGNLLGMLFVRSLERTERVHQAMLSRGYSGKTVRTAEFSARTSDWIKGLVLGGTGIAMLLFDRLSTFKLF